jgi:[acyl-carrier-protein] S-malonyltransferase
MKLDPKTTAFVFPGQGSQAKGMGHNLATHYPLATQTFEEADDILGFALSRLMWEGPEADLNDTLNTQPALYVHSVAAQRVFSHLYPGFQPATVAGHSLGELSALAAAGALSFSDGLRLVRTRGEMMKRAGEIFPGGMAAILGLDIPALEKVCTEASTENEIVQVANDNCPGQVVISGAKAAVARAIEGAKAAGAKRAIPLAVSIAAHSPLMASIQAEWNTVVDACAMNDPVIPVIGNVHAEPMTSANELRADIKAQMSSRVRWTESVQAMLKSGTQAFVEVGSGSVLLGLIRRVAQSRQDDLTVSGYPLGNPDDLEVFKNHLR